jgi:chemotaxis protein methyltransferase WspC
MPVMSLELISALLCQRIGINVDVVGDRAISRAIEVRRLACCLPNLETYLKKIQSSEQEFNELVEQIVIPETSFFRDRKPFDLLVSQIRSQELSKSRSSPLRILSAPCSTGEEPYSIAIALLEAGLPSHRFHIDAIDISQVAIDQAKRAIYGKNSFRGSDWVNRNQYFLKVDDQQREQYEVRPHVRSTVNFRRGNLLDAFVVSGHTSMLNQKYDIIFCRNLLIYLETSVCQRLFKCFHQMLVPDGLLFVGSSETSKVPSESFEYLQQSFAFVYRKRSIFSHQIAKIKKQTNILTETRTVQEIIPQPDVEFQRMQELANVGQLALAIHACKNYLKHNTTHSEAYKLLAILYQATGNYIQSECYFQKTLYLNPNDNEALMNLALLKTARGDKIGADRLHKRLHKRLYKSIQKSVH